MGILVECPNSKCGKLNGQRALARAKAEGRSKGDSCIKCGTPFNGPLRGRVYWIEYYDHKRRIRRERIGSNKGAAEQRYREVMSARTEGRYIKKSPDTRTLFKDLAAWYLDLPEVKAKRSYEKDQMHCKRLMAYFGDRLLKDITPEMVEAYKQKRLSESSHRRKPTKPATVNREVTTFKTVFNKAMKNSKAERNPAQGVKLLKENNARDRILSPGEYARLLAHCPGHLKPIVKIAYHTGMRRGEILNLKWGRITLKEKKGFIKLLSADTKTDEGRDVPLKLELVEMFKAMPRGLPQAPVFTYQGRSILEMKRSFATACKQAGIEDFTFHDFRHTFNTNAYRAGIPIPTIMKITGHKSLSMFRRYTTISLDDLQEAVAKI
jgi:integrase